MEPSLTPLVPFRIRAPSPVCHPSVAGSAAAAAMEGRKAEPGTAPAVGNVLLVTVFLCFGAGLQLP